MDFLGANFLKNIRFFIFGKFLTHQQKKKKNQEIMQYLNMLFLDTSSGALSEYI